MPPPVHVLIRAEVFNAMVRVLGTLPWAQVHELMTAIADASQPYDPPPPVIPPAPPAPPAPPVEPPGQPAPPVAETQ